MAITSYRHVSPHRISGEYSRGYQGQPPRFGVIYATPGLDPATVLWDDGRLITNVSQTMLDLVFAVDLGDPDSLPYWIGKVVEVAINPSATLQPSASFDATVVSIYYRRQNGLDPRIGPIGLCKLLNSDDYIETLTSNLTVLDNR